MKKTKFSAVLTAIAIGGLASALANEYTFSYTGAGISANGLITTSDTLTANVGGTSYSGFQVIGISGERNGQNIVSLVADPSFPSLILVGNSQIDDALLSPAGFDYNGLAFTTAAGMFNLYATDGNPSDGYSEFEVNSSPFEINPIDLSLEAGANVRSVPDGGSTAWLLVASLGCIAFMAHKKKPSKTLALIACGA